MKKIIKKIWLMLICLILTSWNVQAADFDCSKSSFMLLVYDKDTEKFITNTNCMAVQQNGYTYLITSYIVYQDFSPEEYGYIVVLDEEKTVPVIPVQVNRNNYSVVLVGNENAGQKIQGLPIGNSLNTDCSLMLVFSAINEESIAWCNRTFYASNQNGLLTAMENIEIDDLWLGAPIFHDGSDEIVGMGLGLSINTDGTQNYVLADITDDVFEREYSVEYWNSTSGGTAVSSEERPQQEEQPSQESSETESEDGGFSTGIPLIAVVIGLVVGKLIRDKKKGSNENDINANQNANQNIPHNINQDINISDYQPKISKKFYLEGIGGYYAGASFSLEKTLTIGRDPRYCNIVYPSDEHGKGISRQHCQLSIVNEKVVITDLGSKYGTYFQNKERLTPQKQYQVSSGTLFYLAGLSNIFRVIEK